MPELTDKLDAAIRLLEEAKALVPADPPPPPVTTTTFGIAVGYPGVVVDFNHGDFDGYVAQAKGVGATVLRTDYGSGAGTNFGKLYGAARAQGVEVVPILILKSGWSTQTVQFRAQDLVARYPDVRTVELGNEPNGAWSWGAAPNPEQHTLLAKAAAPVLRNGLPGVSLISAGLAEYTAMTSTQMNAVEYRKRELAAGLDTVVDAYGYHPYSDGAWATQLPALRKVMTDAGITKPFVLSETGRDTLNFTETQQADALRTRLVQARATDWITGIYWYSLQDHNSAGASKEDRFGVFRTDWTPKAAVAVLRG